MENVITLNSPTECTSPSPAVAIWQDILAQAMTGELLAAMNYTALSEMCDDPEEVAGTWPCCCFRCRRPEDGRGGLQQRRRPALETAARIIHALHHGS